MTTFTGTPFTHGSWSNAASDAEFRLWGAALEAAVVGAGLTQVSTTANWETDTLSASAGVLGNYSIYKFNDGVTPEVYIKFQYGRGAVSGSGQFKLQVSISGDNSANWSNAHYVVCGATSASATMQWDACFTEGAFILTLDDSVQTSSNPVLLVVERSRNWSDAVSDQGAVFLISGIGQGSTTASNSNGWLGQRINFSPFEKDDVGGGGYMVPGAGASVNASTLTNNTLPVYPYAFSLKEFTWSSRALITVPGAVSSLSSLNVTVGGSTRHYRTSRVVAVGSSSGITGYHMSGHVNAYRWD